MTQPIDAGYGQVLKNKIRQVIDEWLLDDDNLSLWLGHTDEKLTASRRRILISHFVGEAHQRLQHPNYHGFIWNCFERTGCLITVDGSGDSKIKPEGLSDYEVLPPLSRLGPDEAPEIAVVEAEPPEDILEPEIDEDFEEINEDQDQVEPILEIEEEDNECDRVFRAKLVGKKICADYISGWHTGTVRYYNRKLQKYLLAFADGSTDLITEEDIDGFEMQFVDSPQKRSKRINYAALNSGDLDGYD